MLLAIDTATRSMSLALHNGVQLLAEQTCVAGNQQNSQLAPSIHQLADRCGVSLADLTAVAVCTGPGSYTGLRVGVALAKGIAMTSGVPLVAVPTLEILAAGVTQYKPATILIAIVQAGRGRIIAGHFRRKSNAWYIDTEPYITTWEDLIASLEEGKYLFTGEINEAGQIAIATAAESVQIALVSVSERARRAGNLAELGWASLCEAGGQMGQPVPENIRQAFKPALVQPVYLKSPTD